MLLSFLSFPATAQTMQVQGRLSGDEKQDLESATVRCYTSDTVFVAGTTTNMKGLFELRLPSNGQKYQLRFNYLGYKETTLTLYPTKESLVRLGDIRLDKQVEQLQEVTVLGANEVRMEDRTMYYPTRAQLRHAYNGYSAVEMLMIPGVMANGSSIAYFGKSVLLCIDGREATPGEVQDLNPNDIKRVDFYSQGRPDYPKADVVFDYILKERDYVGSVALSANHQLNRPTGGGRGTVQFFEGKSEWTVSVSDSYNHFKLHPDISTETTYLFPEETITKTEQRLPSLEKSNNLQAYLNYIYKDKRQMFYSSFRINRTNGDEDMWMNQQYSNTAICMTKQEQRNSASLNPAMQLYYSNDLPSKQKLKVGIYGSCGNNQYKRWFEQRDGENIASAYNNGTDEKSYYGRMTVDYSKIFSNFSTLALAADQNFTYTDNKNTTMNELSRLFLYQSNTRFSASYNYKIRKTLNMQLQLAEEISHVRSSGHNVTTTSFVPSLKFSYSHKKHMLELVGMVKSGEPGLSDRTGYEYLLDEYEMFLGNPELKNYLEYNGSLMYNWNISRRWNLIAYSELEAISNQVYPYHRYDMERNMFVYQSLNGGKCLWSHSEIALDYAIIPRQLFFRTTSIYNHTITNIWKRISYDSFLWTCNVRWVKKGWFVRMGYMSPTKGMDFAGVIRNYPYTLSLDVRYSVNNFHISVSAKNPHKARAGKSVWQPEYLQKSVNRIPRRDDHIVSLTFNYRFTFGKKKHQFEDSSVEDVNRTTISKE